MDLRPEHRKNILIIGGGSIGLMSAKYLSDSGHRVTLLEKGSVGMGASYGNAGFLVPSTSYPLAAPGMIRDGVGMLFRGNGGVSLSKNYRFSYFRWLWRFWKSSSRNVYQKTSDLLYGMGQKSIELHKSLADEMRVASDLSPITGRFELYQTEDGFQKGLKKSRILAGRGINSNIVGPGWKQKETLPANFNELKGFYYSGDGFIDPYQTLLRLSETLKNQGVEIVENARVQMLIVDGHQVLGAIANQKEYYADEVILATGIKTNSLLKESHVNKILLEAGAGYSLTVKNPTLKLKHPVMLADSHIAITPLNDNSLRFAGTMTLGDSSFKINKKKVQYIKDSVSSHLGEDFWSENQSVTIWKGHRPCTPDGLPVIGRPKNLHGLIIATGHCTLGMHLGPVTGFIVNDIVNDNISEFNLNYLSPARF